jgi:hypothetical protein
MVSLKSLSAGLLVSTIALFCGGCAGTESRRSAEKEAIEKALGDDWGTTAIPIGTASFSAKEMTVVRAAESAGLLNIRETPSSTGATETKVELTATPKLRLLATGDAVPGNQEGMKLLLVRISDCRVDKISSDEVYKGPLVASPVERYRVVVGTYNDIPTAAAAEVGEPLATQTVQQRKFRCVVKYRLLRARWEAVACDTGLLNSKAWRTSNVQ